MPRSAATTLGPMGRGQVIIMRPPTRPPADGSLYVSSARHADPTLVTTAMLEAIVNAIREPDNAERFLANLAAQVKDQRRILGSKYRAVPR